MHLSDAERAALQDEAALQSRLRAFERSVPIRERLVALAPENWRYALDLIEDLREAGKAAEADDVHRRAVLRFPREFWVLYHWAMAAWVAQDYAAAAQRALPLLALLPRFPAGVRDEFEFHASGLLGDLAMRRFAYSEAAQYFSRGCELAPDDVKKAVSLRRANDYVRLAAAFGTPPLPSHQLHAAADYDVLVINLDRDTERFAGILARFQDSPVTLHRIPGVPGSYLPRVAMRALCRGDPRPVPGSAGCMLTHVKAWETMLARGLDICLILEDDAIPMINLPQHFVALGIPADFDICFVNGRMEPQFGLSAPAGRDGPMLFDPIEAFITRPPTHNSPGTDGYFISAAGAAKLLSFIERDGLYGDIDWRLVGYSVARGAGAALPQGSTPRILIEQMENVSGERLRAYTMYPCLVSHGTFASTRMEESSEG